MKNFAGYLATVALLTLSLTAGAADKLLADRHAERGVKCESCHVSMPPAAIVKNEACLKCHVSYEKIAERTDEGDINPHASHVEDASCAECHSGHKKPRLLCDQCHEFTDIRVP